MVLIRFWGFFINSMAEMAEISLPTPDVDNAETHPILEGIYLSNICYYSNYNLWIFAFIFCYNYSFFILKFSFNEKLLCMFWSYKVVTIKCDILLIKPSIFVTQYNKFLFIYYMLLIFYCDFFMACEFAAVRVGLFSSITSLSMNFMPLHLLAN